METAAEWQNRRLKKCYTFLFVDCFYISIRKDMETKNCAVYVILGYDVNGVKDILGVWIGETDKYVPSKDYKAYTAQLKKVYGASSLKAAEAEFERFKQAWSNRYLE